LNVMLKASYHPNAFLQNLRNVPKGLRARTRILNVLEKGPGTAKIMAGKAEENYGVVMHHLKLLHSEGIVHRSGGKPFVWTLTGTGQRRLSNASYELHPQGER
jgi:predicted transcriptional regulator